MSSMDDSSPSRSSTFPSSTPPSLDGRPSLDKHDRSADWDSFDGCSGPGLPLQMLGRRKRRKNESLFGSLRSWIVQHQIGISINLLMLLALTHICFPRVRRRTRSFFELSYFEPSTGKYAQGPDDFYFVAFWILVFTGLRAGIMEYVLLPCAAAAGLSKTKTKVRFAEQAWLLLYDSIFWSLGMYIMYHTKYWFNFRELWTDWPTRLMDGTLKWYYLVQFAFWIQQILVVNIEERRKDYAQMLTHHIVTCALMLLSYGHYQTKAGNIILCVMDVVDIILPAAKMLKYTGFKTACDVAFGVFIAVWFAARHVVYLMICWSIYHDIPEVMTLGCYNSVTGEHLSPDGGNAIWSNLLQPFVNPGGPICYHKQLRYGFLGLLLFLQCITCLWFVMILRVAWRVLQGAGADDSRSDDEASEKEDVFDDEVEAVATAPRFAEKMGESLSAPPVEETVGVEGLNLRQRRASPRYRATNRKAGSHSGALSISGHSDRKELLGRIGCDKPT